MKEPKSEAANQDGSSSASVSEADFRAALKTIEDLLACCETMEEYASQTEDPEAFYYLVNCATAFANNHRQRFQWDWGKDFEEAVL
jgi:hypothetical protein